VRHDIAERQPVTGRDHAEAMLSIPIQLSPGMSENMAAGRDAMQFPSLRETVAASADARIWLLTQSNDKGPQVGVFHG